MVKINDCLARIFNGSHPSCLYQTMIKTQSNNILYLVIILKYKK